MSGLPNDIIQRLDSCSVDELYKYLEQRHRREVELTNTDGLNTVERYSDSSTSDLEEYELDSYDSNHLFESIQEVVYHYILEHAYGFKEPDYIDKFKGAVQDIVFEQITPCYTMTVKGVKYELNTEYIYNLIDTVFHTFIGGFFPLRSTDTNHNLKPLTQHQIQQLSNHIQWIRTQPQPDQRTTEWYEFRYNLITASSAWKLLDTKCQKNRYIYEKCKPLDTNKYGGVSIYSTLHWGHKYEPLATLYYETMYDTKIEEFGCIVHQTDKWIGASPDGINVSSSSPRYGRMLEIKNIVNREITGIPKKEYWIQMQLQMEVCQLPECDFLECRFKEYDSRDEFLNDGTWTQTKDGKFKGVFIMFSKDDYAEPLYQYPPTFSMNETEWEQWEEETVQSLNHQGWKWCHTIYWRLDQASCVLVERNPYWYQSVRNQFKEAWKSIEQERITGYEYRCPPSKPKKKKRVESTGCVLSINTDNL